MLKKLFRKIKLGFYLLFFGMRNADRVILSSAPEELSANDVGGIEQHQERHTVYEDLLKGELTEEVRMLRHEMYYAERKSKEYVFDGGERARKNTLFEFKGHVDRSDDLPIILVQDNSSIAYSLYESGVDTDGDKYTITDSAKMNRNLNNLERRFRINLEFDFIPKFKLEAFIKKVVVKKVNEDLDSMDIYISKYVDPFKPITKLFHIEMEKIFIGDKKNDLLQFKRMKFQTRDAYGFPDCINLVFSDFEFNTILEFDGNYVLRFYTKLESQKDELDEIYHEPTAKKCENHERRENAIVYFDDAKEIFDKNNSTNDSQEDEELIALSQKKF